MPYTNDEYAAEYEAAHATFSRFNSDPLMCLVELAWQSGYDGGTDLESLAEIATAIRVHRRELEQDLRNLRAELTATRNRLTRERHSKAHARPIKKPRGTLATDNNLDGPHIPTMPRDFD